MTLLEFGVMLKDDGTTVCYTCKHIVAVCTIHQTEIFDPDANVNCACSCHNFIDEGDCAGDYN